MTCAIDESISDAFIIKNQSEVIVTFIDRATGKYLYAETNPIYNKDSLKVFDPKGNSLIILKVLRINTATFEEYRDVSFGNI